MWSSRQCVNVTWAVRPSHGVQNSMSIYSTAWKTSARPSHHSCTSTRRYRCRYASSKRTLLSVGKCQSDDAIETIDEEDYSQPSIVVYSKQDCELCTSFVDKVEKVVTAERFVVNSKIKECMIQIRDVEDEANPSWRRHLLHVPLLTIIEADGEERLVKGCTPRLSPARLKQTLEKHLSQTAKD